MKGSKKAIVHPVFKRRLTDLVEKAQGLADGFRQTGQRPWHVPADLGAADLFDVPQLHSTSFDRQAINTNYEQCFQSVTSPGTVGDVIALKHQVDYNAIEERAFRFRHASVCRCLTHGAGRRYGESVGPTFPYVEATVADVIAAGAAE